VNAFICSTRATAAGCQRSALTLGLALAATSIAAQPAPRAPPSFTVVFDDCTEFAGLGPLAATQVEGLVPPGYTAAAFGQGLAGIVARVARCERVSVDGSSAEKGTVAQIGINLVSPDGTGDINNDTLVYVTDSWRLAERLLRLGLPVRLDPKLVYEVNPAASALELYVQVDAIAGATYFLHGSVTEPAPGAQFPFLANWYYSGRVGRLRMSTQIPAFAAGPADRLGGLQRVEQRIERGRELVDTVGQAQRRAGAARQVQQKVAPRAARGCRRRPPTRARRRGPPGAAAVRSPWARLTPAAPA